MRVPFKSFKVSGTGYYGAYSVTCAPGPQVEGPSAEDQMRFIERAVTEKLARELYAEKTK